MLRLILGRAGSGKTETVRRLAAESAALRPTVLLVPEQSSFENERAMLRRLGPKDAQGVQVLSFSRLCDMCFARYGGQAGRRLDDGGRAMFMSLALEDVKDGLEFYAASAAKGQLAGLMLAACAELKKCGITTQELLGAAERAQGSLPKKLRELSLVLGAYDALVAQSYIDPLDDLDRLKPVLDAHDFFGGKAVFLDAFQSFTVQEYEVLRRILLQAEDITVTLCTDMLDDPERGVGLFSLVRGTGARLVALAKECGARVAAPVLLAPGLRFENAGLAALEAGAYRVVKEKFWGESPAVVYLAQNAYDEVEYVSAAIRELVRAEGFRYRDIAIIARTPDAYAGVLDTALERREIPAFMDMPAPVRNEPLMRMVLSAFGALRSSFRSDEVLAFLKTGLAGLSTEEISVVENYVFTWNISGRKWCAPWTEHPRGFVEKSTPADERLLADVNAFRERAIRPLLALEKAVAQGDGESMAAAVYHLLEHTGAAEGLRALAQRLEENGRPALAERQLRLWDLLMELLDQMALVLRGRYLGRDRFADLLALVIDANDLASIPQVLDEVVVGAADRMRPNKPLAVFVLGAAQGDFPLTPAADRVFSDTERRTLIAMGLPLNETLEGTAVQERYLAYTAMCGAARRLYVCCPEAAPGGEAKTPSSIVEELRELLPETPVLRREGLPLVFFANAEAPAFEALARGWREQTAFEASLREAFARRPAYTARLEALGRAAERRPLRFTQPENALRLFGGPLRLSATQVEKFHLCRFQYFCRFGLNVKERRAARMDALEYGSLMHYILEHLFKEKGAAALVLLSVAELTEEIAQLLQAYVDTKLGGLAEKTPRFVRLFERLAGNAAVVVAHIARELAQSDFVPEGFELDIGRELPALRVPMPGGDVLVEGKLDRVDVFERGGVKYIRVVDYKTGKKEFKLADLVYGVNMQMLIYLAALCESSDGTFAGSVPAGVLYMPAARPLLTAARGATDESVLEDEQKKLRMNGFLTDDPIVLRAMEPDGAGKYIPVALGDEGALKRDNVATPAELRAVLAHIKGTIGSMAEMLREGHVEAEPLVGEYDACEWCPYAPVCGREKDGPARRAEKWDRTAALLELTGAKKTTEGGGTT